MSIEDRNTSVASMILFRDFFFFSLFARWEDIIWESRVVQSMQTYTLNDLSY